MAAREIKDLAIFHRALDEMKLEEPEVVLVSGSDTGVVDRVLERLRTRLRKEEGAFESVVFSGEPGDEVRLHEEVCNIPLFSPYRLIIVRAGEELFRTVLAQKARAAVYKRDFAHIPDRTLLVIAHAGAPTKSLLSLFGDRILHLVTRDLYPNQVQDQIRAVAARLHLRLDEEAMHALRESLDPRQSGVEAALQRLKAVLTPEELQRSVPVTRVREILFPSQGWDSFVLVDALFALDHRTLQRELLRFNPGNDSFLAILKLMLNRANEIRMARAGRDLGMNDEELLEFLDLKNRHPFVKKKILQRLGGELANISDQQLGAIYQLLVQLHRDFRGVVPVSNHKRIFEERALEVFFLRSATPA